tara:strand:+ start:180 stop:476 length:297 start_codon:yes stop_codon:yes gene_type:complete
MRCYWLVFGYRNKWRVTIKTKQKLERANLVESIATKDAWLHPYELLALKKHSKAMAKDEKIRLAKLDAKYKEIRIAQLNNCDALELKLFRELEEIENG